MDVLATQASSVSVECVFSAAADTDESDCNRMTADLWEAFEVCKYSTCQRRTSPLDFTEHFCTPEEDYILLDGSDDEDSD
jgi:hypothetical protein